MPRVLEACFGILPRNGTRCNCCKAVAMHLADPLEDLTAQCMNGKIVKVTAQQPRPLFGTAFRVSAASFGIR